MSDQPRSIYKPPTSEDGSYSETFRIWPTGDPEDGHTLVIRVSIYRGKCVDYAINQTMVAEDGEHPVARIDCCHGTVHRHQFGQAGRELCDPEIIMEIPTGQSPEIAWEFIQKSYGLSLDVMENEWERNYRRWHDDSP